MSNARKIKIESISKDKVVDIIHKINKLVDYYAERTNSPWGYETNFLLDIGKNPSIKRYNSIMLKRINMEREYHHNGFGNTYKNSPFKQTQCMYNFIKVFTAIYYPEYLKIESFIEKLFYNHPTKVAEKDFIEMNNLYKKIKSKEEILTAKEQIERE